MNIFKKRTIWVVALLVSHMIVFVVGATIARNIAMKFFLDEGEKADAHVLLGHYTGYRDIAVDIKEGKSVEAKCLAELSASAMFDSLKACIGDSNCRSAIEEKTRKSAPEVLGESPLAFAYKSSKEGIKVCTD